MGGFCVLLLRAKRVVEQAKVQKAAGFTKMEDLFHFVDRVVQQPSEYAEDPGNTMNTVNEMVEAIVIAMTPAVKPWDLKDRIGRLAPAVRRVLGAVLNRH